MEKNGTVEPGLAAGPWSLTDHGKCAEMKLKTNPYDLESWSILLREAQSTAPIRARMLFERLVTQFPTSVRYWRVYIEQEVNTIYSSPCSNQYMITSNHYLHGAAVLMAAVPIPMRQRSYERVEKLFQRCLMSVLHIDLWRCYVAYIRETKVSLPTYREKLRQAYEFALDYVGIDFHSTPLWLEYIDCLNKEEALGSFAENQKIQSIRKAYQQTISSPRIGIERLWRDYNSFEQSVNKAMAKKLIETQSKFYVNARRAALEYDNVTRGLIRGAVSIPSQGTVQEVQQLGIWRRYIAWEKQNPLRNEDKSGVVKRVMYAYDQCLLCFGFCPDIWCEACFYLQRASEAGDSTHCEQWGEEAIELYARAVNGPMKDNLLVNFAYADFEEGKRRHESAEGIYKRLLDNKELDPTLVYVQYMKFAVRTGGTKKARSVFKQAREDARCGHHVYVAAGLMEYYTTKDKDIAFRIFELGMKKFGDNPDYLMAYIDHTSHLNEDNNTRVLFEKALSSVPAEHSSEIWEKFMAFEACVGDLSSLLKVEQRRSLAMRSQNTTANLDSILLVDRYKFFGKYPCSTIELQLIGHPCAVQSTARATGTNRASKGREENITVRPDVNQMTPFRPSTSHGVGMNAVPGGHFPLPSAVAALMPLLPPPDSFQGPFVVIDELVELIMQCSIPDVPTSSSNQAPDTGGSQGQKRQREGGEGSDEDGDNAPPSHDLYRSRQQKRINTTS